MAAGPSLEAEATHAVEVPPALDRARVDAVLAEHTPLSRSRVSALIDEGRVARNGAPVARASTRVDAGDHLSVSVPPPRVVDTLPQDLPLEIVHEDEDLIVVNKAPGVVVHPAPGHPDGTLVNALLFHCGRLSSVGGTQRPGIVHRIDKDTSGLLIASKTDRAHHHLQALFAAHTIERQYEALCVRLRGPTPPESGTFDTLHGRHPKDRKRFTGKRGPRRATTHYRVVERFGDGAFHASCTLATGRTHQIRVHLSEAGYPLLGDPLYGGRAAAKTRLIDRVALHASVLGVTHPDGHALRFTADPPEDWRSARDRLNGGASWRA